VRIAVVSDIHGNIEGLDACLEDLRAQGGADRIVAAGDLCMDGPKPRKVLKRLQEIDAACVRGNTDRVIGLGGYRSESGEVVWQREQIGVTWMKWLAELPQRLRFGEAGNELMVTHANPKSDDEHVWPDAKTAQLERLFGDETARAYAFGHLHVPYVRTWGDKLLTCVASAGLPKDGDPRAHYAILTSQDGGWQVKSRRVEFDVEKVARQIRKSGMPDIEERLDVLYRHRYKSITKIIP
jgi:putative phosphoesterase